MLTAYLVITGLTTVSPPPAGSRWPDRALMLVALGVGLAQFTFGVEAFMSPTGSLNGIPFIPFFIFGSISLLASAADLRMIRAGGVQALRGVPRLTRHLWRMCVALLIAAFSFFLGQTQVFPKPIRIIPLLATPPLVVFVAMLYWLWRARRKQTLRVTLGANAVEAI